MAADLWADPDFVLDELEAEGPPPRQPRAGDPLIARGERLTVLAYDPATARLRYEDADGFALHRARSTVWWDGSAWRTWGAA